MTRANIPTEAGLVSCEICLQGVPISEAQSSEGVDYVVYFCGTDCYTKWIEQSEETKPEQSKKQASGN